MQVVPSEHAFRLNLTHPLLQRSGLVSLNRVARIPCNYPSNFFNTSAFTAS